VCVEERDDTLVRIGRGLGVRVRDILASSLKIHGVSLRAWLFMKR
jgi:hypothetical protein